MKIALIGAVLLVAVLGGLFVATGGADTTSVGPAATDASVAPVQQEQASPVAPAPSNNSSDPFSNLKIN